VDALAAFQRGQQLAGPSVVPSLLFNTARAMKAAGDPHAQFLFRQYLSIDATSEWAAEARRQLGEEVAIDTKPRDEILSETAPQVQGITLGDSFDKVQGSWGAPQSVTGDTVKIMAFPTRGLSVAISPVGGVEMLALLTRRAGAVDGIRVGDPVAAARTKWGTPAEQQGDDLFFDRGTWAIATHSQGAIITVLVILSHH